jgi:cell division transport system permease protein
VRRRSTLPCPFLLEAVVTTVISVILAGGALETLIKFGVQDKPEDSLAFIPWISWPELTTSLVVLAILGPLLTLVPTLLLTPKVPIADHSR